MASYVAATTYRRPLHLTVFTVVASLLAVVPRPGADIFSSLGGAPLFVWFPLVIGLWVGARRQVVAGLRERAERLEREEAARTERARAQERARIARDMHDVVAHRVSLMVLRAGALEINAVDEKIAAEAELIRVTGKEALEQLRAVLGILTEVPRRRPMIGEEVLEPQPTLADLDWLLDQSRSVGVPVERRDEGTAQEVPVMVQHTAYRMVQEALTNIHKHAGMAATQVVVRYLPSALEVTIKNSVPSDRTPGHARQRARPDQPERAHRTAGRRVHRQTGAGRRFPCVREVADVIRVLIADDEALVRTGLRMILEAADDLEVVAEAANGVEAVTAVARHGPHVVLMDVQMPRMDGVAALKEMNRSPNPPKVVMLTTFDRDEYVYSALRAKAAGFLLKDTAPRDLIAAVRTVADGSAMLAPTVTKRMIDAFAGQQAPDARAARERLAALTDRERQVVQAVARGLANAEIARELTMSETTVKAHVSRSLAKLGLVNRVQIALLVRDAGWPRF